QRLYRSEKRDQPSCAVAKPANVRDPPGKLAGEAKGCRSHFDPTTNSMFRRNSMKCRVNFNRRKIAGVELQPPRLRQIGRIKGTAQVLEGPCARADSNFLLIS